MSSKTPTVRHVSLKSQLLRGYGLLALLLVLLAGVALHSLRSADADFSRFVERDLQRMTTATELRGAAFSHFLDIRGVALAQTPEGRTQAIAKVAPAAEIVNKGLETLQQNLSKFNDSDGTEREMVAKIIDISKRYHDAGDKVIRVANTGARQDALNVVNDELTPGLRSLVAEVNAYGSRASKAGVEHENQMRANAASSRWVIAVILLAAVAVVGGAVFLQTRRMQRTIGGEVAELSVALDKLASGDLGPVKGAQTAPEGSLLKQLGTVQESMRTAVSAVRGNAESVSGAASEIAQGNQDLSQRSEAQAASLTRTASAMEELQTTVRNNADHARQAVHQSGEATSAAVEGGRLMDLVVGTMKEIHTSSSRIADIIGVIDSIAFQTNILALNAAVEAARAGEQGRGFAVVASEVRTLAHRSSEAAKEIRALITESVNRIDAGSEQVNHAGTSMNAIVTSIQRVATLIEGISAASEQQAQGIGEVNTALVDMDRSTQQNAALVEESAAAAESLRDQARNLVSAVEAFRNA